MEKKVGICTNPLDKEHFGEEQEVELGKPFVCEFCGRPLTPASASGKKGTGKKKLLIGAVIVLVLVAGGVAFSLSGGPSQPAQPASDSQSEVTQEVAPAPAETPTEAEPEAVAEPEAAAQVEPEAPVEVTPAAADPAFTGRGTVKLPYGTYTGDLKEGKPHGYGTITYTKSQKIVPSQKFVAQPGDTFEGDFRNGKISGLGYWTHQGNKTVVKP